MKIFQRRPQIYFLLIIALSYLFFNHYVAYAAQGPLDLGRIEIHHIFPKNIAMRPYFAERKIDPDLHCIPLTRSEHISKGGVSIHTKKFAITGGQNYLQSWHWFISTFPNSKRFHCFFFAGLLLSEYGIKEGLEYYDYKTGKKTGEKMRMYVYDKIRPILEQIGVKNLPKLKVVIGKLAVVLAVAHEAYSVASEMDDRFIEERFFDSADAHLVKAASYFEAEEYEKMQNEISDVYFYIGYGAVDKLRQKLGGNFYSDIANMIYSEPLERLSNVALVAFKKAIEIKYSNCFAHLFLSMVYVYNKNYEEAKKSASKVVEITGKDSVYDNLLPIARDILQIADKH